MTTEAITQLPLDQLTESPFNPRKTFTGITELVDNIRAEGRIHSPLLVRPVTPNPLRDDIISGYEVIFGHRRLRAAEAAGLATVPCMVRAMTDAEARCAQVAENLARQDVHPIEEAEGFALMIEQDGISADQLAANIGKSRSYVYSRLKLLEACAEIRTACLEGSIGSEVAVLIARLRTDKLQQKALAAIRNDTSQHSKLDDGGKKSFRHIRDLLAEKFTLQLSTAIFDPEDPRLLPEAGVCGACPKRAGNAPEYADLAAPTREGTHRGYTAAGGPNTCTDPDCFDAKKQAHLAQQATKLAQDGAVVIVGNKARAAIGAHGDVKGDFISLDDVRKLLKASKTKPADVPQVSIQDPRTGKVVKAVKRFDLVAMGVVKKEDAAPSHQARQSQMDLKRRAEQDKAESKAATLTKRYTALLQHVRATAAHRTLGAFELRMAAAAALAGVGYNDRPTLMELHGASDLDALKAAIDTMEPAALTALLIDCLLVDGVRVESWRPHLKPAPLLALADHYGVDADAVMQASEQPVPPPAESTSTPSPAARAAKGAAPGGKAKAKTPAAMYRCAATGSTWSGKGLKPVWLKVALAQGKTLDSFLAKVKTQAKKVSDEAGFAGVERDPNTADMFEGARA